MTTALSEYQRALTALYVKSLRYEGPAEFLDFSFASADPARRMTVSVARLRLPCEDGEDLWFSGSLGPAERGIESHGHFFLGVYDSEDLALVELVAAAHHFDLAVEALGYGHTFPLGGASRLRQAGYEAALILDAALYSFFDGVDLSRLGLPATLFSVLPITASEWALKREQGLDVLLEDWDKRKRDALHVQGARVS